MAQERIPVVTTTSDLRSLVEAVGGDPVAATSLVPANFDAEDYQDKPQDVVRVKSARMVVRVGLDDDLWFDRVLAQTARPEIQRGGAGYVDASYAIAVLEVRGMTVGPGDGHAHGSGNPHYWLIRRMPKSSPAIFSKHWRDSTRRTAQSTRQIAPPFWLGSATSSTSGKASSAGARGADGRLS